MPREFFTIRNKSADNLEIDIEGPIGGIEIDWSTWEINAGPTKESVKKLIKEVANSAASTITVNINSYGGDVNHGVSIHDMLAAHKAKVTTIVHGHTASAATIIAQAGNTRKMSSNALYLIHPASTGVWGNSNDVATALSDLEKVDKTIAEIYAKRSGKSVDEVRSVMNRFDGRGEWLTAQEAKDLGLIDEIIEPMKAVASVDPKIMGRLGLPQIPTNKIFDMKADKQTVFAWFEEFITRMTGGKTAQVEEPTEPVEPEEPVEPATEPESTTEPAEPEPAEPTPAPEPEPEPEPTARQEIVVRDMEEVRQVLDDLTTQNADLERRLQDALNENARLKGTPTQTTAKEDPFLDRENLKTNEAAYEANAKALREK